jgi:hypothetical protein
MADTGPGWPADDPAALRQWLESKGAGELGLTQNNWATLIFLCTSRIGEAHDPGERRAYRDTALAALEAGRRVGALDDAYYTEQAIYTRMSYLRHSGHDDSWRRAEMAQVADIFLTWLPVSLEDARDMSARWREQPREILSLHRAEILSLRRAKTFLKLIEPGASYLTGRREQLISDWLSAMPQLP